MFIEGSREVALKKFVVVDGFGYNSTDKLEIVQVVWVGEQRLLTSGFSGES